MDTYNDTVRQSLTLMTTCYIPDALLESILRYNLFYGFDRGIFDMSMPRPYAFVLSPIPHKWVVLTHPVIINQDVWQYGLMIKAKTEIERTRNGKRIKRGDYPSCASGCFVTGSVDTIALDYSGRGYSLDFHPELMALFRPKLGDVPYEESPVTGSKNTIGNCAEQRAVNDMLKHAGCKVSDLTLSKAIRPRTMTFWPYCENCIELFFRP